MDTDEEGIRELAQLHLQCYCDPQSSSTDLTALMAGLGVIFEPVHLPKFPHWPGMGCHSWDGFALIILNTVRPEAERTWTIGHELGHIALEHASGCDDRKERAANIYASEVLLPRRRICLQWNQFCKLHVEQDVIRIMSHANHVSVPRVRDRLLELGWIGQKAIASGDKGA